MAEISIHNSASEFVVDPEVINKLGYETLVYSSPNGSSIPYRQLRGGFQNPGPCKVFLFLHGAGSVGEDNFLQMRLVGAVFVRYLRNHPKEKILFLCPQCRKDCKWVDVPWSDLKHDLPEEPSLHMRLAMELLNTKLEEFEVDRNHIYAGGISMGGYGAWDIVSRMPSLFAGVLPICGGADLKQAEKLKNAAAYIVHGEKDSVVPVSRSKEMFQALKAVGNQRVIYREIPGADHNSWDAVLPEDQPFEWLFSQGKIQ